MRSTTRTRPRPVEWPTAGLTFLTYAVWAGATAWAGAIGLWIALPLIALTASMHTSLTHEVVHGHPTRRRALNHLLVAPAISLFVPHERYEATHLAHHHDPRLTDPYDDPESNYLDPAAWARLAGPVRWLMRVNNTLLGRMLLGPALSLACFYGTDLRLMLAGDRAVLRAWALHLPCVAVVAIWLAQFGEVSAGLYLAAAYAGTSLQKIRSYLEHRAHPQARGRTVIVEDRGPLAFLFLNNNLHAVHHAHPAVPWYELPALYRRRRTQFLKRNLGYRFAGYGDIFRAFLVWPKDPVPHPLMPGATEENASGAEPERSAPGRQIQPAA